MSARVLVDSTRKELRVAPHALFSDNGLSRLVVHKLMSTPKEAPMVAAKDFTVLQRAYRAQ